MKMKKASSSVVVRRVKTTATATATTTGQTER